MACVTQEEITPFMPVAAAGRLTVESFPTYEEQARIIVESETGMVMPETPEERTEAQSWIIVPMAWLVTHIAMAGVSNQSDDLRRVTSQNYEAAFTLMRKHIARRTQPDPASEVINLDNLNDSL
jgi:hypothetical protein